ncbi:hemerythrin domain-containing protein [Aestuariivirga sp.]|uniref:hemerythrin domain-containing protein n=1 Tax=Aestuariivirga sp. TaxID=2650926 RepID=UPI0025C1690D|nr:hemerythrin domain-containing protein [Aestuariivirga sp.]MCA3555381.1 hemerythrin domain-containing protein [Aestuariivirga sp.]
MSDKPIPPARNPLDMIASAHALQMQMCDAMERIADGLPDEVDRRLCAQVASWLQFDLPLHHHDEEVGLFPLLRRRASPGDGLDKIIERLAAEHSSDSDFASEIAEALDALGQGGRPANPEMLGYMLRGFFERYRRHVHWENQLVMPLARLRLTAEDLAQLQASMNESRRQAS